jgi:hypothetical protein
MTMGGSAVADMFGLVGLDIFKPIDDAATELDELRAFTRPAPALQRSV